jgi:hypothetical protein
MNYLGYVNTEGGPLLISDVALVCHWNGIVGTDYNRACALYDADETLEGIEIEIKDGKAFLWEMRGAGTAEIFKINDNHLVIVRIWPTDPLDSSVTRLIAGEPLKEIKRLGNLTIETCALAVLWAAEDGTCIEFPANIKSESGRPIGEIMIDDSGLMLSVRCKKFTCVHDEVETAFGSGRRLHLIASDSLA